MRICHVTPHLPPDQAANALLPFFLGQWAVSAGHEVSYVAHPPRSGEDRPRVPATYIRSRRDRPAWVRRLRLAALAEALRIVTDAGPLLARADLVHVHGNGLLAEVAGLLALRRGKPVVLTIYGTEIWHYERRGGSLDLFSRLYRRVQHVTFYSQGLLDRARALGLDRPGLSVIYPPVLDGFVHQDAAQQGAWRARLGITHAHLLLNVKRLHPLAGQRYLIEALPTILSVQPDTALVICGTGPLRDELRELARTLGVASHVTFAGLVDNARVAHYCAAADAFVLPSLLEACPTVAVEALASGTPVVSADHPGGVELHGLFGDDVVVVPRRNPVALAGAVVDLLEHKRRARPETAGVLAREFRPAVVFGRYASVYEQAIDARRHARMPR